MIGQVTRASELIRESFGQDDTPRDEPAHRSVMRKIAVRAGLLLDVGLKPHRLRDGEDYGFPCPCRELGWIIQKQQFRKAEDRFYRWALPQARECLMASMAWQLGWRTLRGPGRRREFLEKAVPSKFPEELSSDVALQTGRPEQIFLDRSDYEVVRRFIRHARKEGRRHVERSTLERVVTEINWSGSEEEETIRSAPVWLATGVAQGVDEFLTNGPGAEPTEGEVRAFLATVLGCSERTVRRRFPEEFDASEHTGFSAKYLVARSVYDGRFRVELLKRFSGIEQALREWETERHAKLDDAQDRIEQDEIHEDDYRAIAREHGYSLEELLAKVDTA